MKISVSQENLNTIFGILAILFWGTTIAFSRSLTEQLGPLTAASWIYMLSGIWGCIYLINKPEEIKKTFQLPILYLIGCGTLFIFYMVCLYLAVGLAFSREQVIEVSIINYLWPGLTLIFSLPILHKKGKIILIPGIVIAFAGFYLATVQSGMFSWEVFKGNFQVSYLPYLLAFMAAITWGLYSNLVRRWAGHTEGGAVPLFLLATGLVLTTIRFMFPEESYWTPHVIVELLYMSVFPTFLAYTFWDRAMRKGKIILVVSLSYFTPLLSIVISSLYLQVAVKANLWIACGLVIAGAIICKFSIIDKTQKESAFK
ncbi:aromatic amino acid DMT transporter YddG [bacterium]|nr:aromatic amino acid DMT transporter YddG [bacterium]MBU4361569.1 aromatic amino acid DMT transporter YddG [bacterium]MBU4602606.1 aromatic amino acid DMT transporter YddG [bacterium]